MTLLTVGGKLLNFDDLPTFSVVESSGELASGQNYTAKVPTDGPGYMGVIFAHGFGGDDTDLTDPGQMDTTTTYLASVGFPCIAGELGGVTNWGNDASRTAMTECRDFLVSDLGADPATVGLVGISMGVATMFSWVSDGHLTETGCVAALAPCVDLQGIVDGDLGGLGNFIQAAYGGAAGWTAAQPTHDPMPLAEAGAFDGLACKLWYGLQDAICIPQAVLDFAAEFNAQLVSFDGDHAASLTMVNAYQVASFIIGSYEPTRQQRTFVSV
jgi:hypothetical protein